MKYIVVRIGGVEFPLIFARELAHDEVADAVGRETVTAAGFIAIEATSAVCSGASTSLGIRSRRAIDADLVMRWLADKR